MHEHYNAFMTKKRTYLFVDLSAEYKQEFLKCMEEKYESLGVALPKRVESILSPEVRRLLEQEYPSLKAIAEKERNNQPPEA